MELTILGKYGPYGKAKTGAASGYLIKNGDDYIVLDMGSGTLSRLMGVADITKIKSIFISHLHYDHTSDLLPFRYLLEDLGHRVTIYTHYEESDWYRILFDHPNFDVVNIDERSEITIGAIKLSFKPMLHSVTDYAIKIKGDATLCYTGDTKYNDNLAWCFEDSDVVLMDCSKKAGSKAPHMTVEDAKMLASKTKARIIATHHSVDFDPTSALSECKNIITAKEMETYRI